MTDDNPESWQAMSSAPRPGSTQYQRAEYVTPVIFDDAKIPAEHVVKMATERDHFIILDDGFTYYAPEGMGGIRARELRALANELDRRNAPVEKSIKEWFEIANSKQKSIDSQ